MYRHSSKIKTPYCQESNVYIFYLIHPSSACLYFLYLYLYVSCPSDNCDLYFSGGKFIHTSITEINY